MTACDDPVDADAAEEQLSSGFDDAGAEEPDESDAVAPVEGPHALAGDAPEDPTAAYGLSTSYWPSHVIPVCWENPSQSDLWWRAVTQAAIESTWQKQSALTFTGWGTCTATSKGIRILISDQQPGVVALGKALDGVQNGMVLNLTFNNWDPGCTADLAAKEHCVSGIAIHEFGHAIGFAHEQNRPDTPPTCTDAPQGDDGNVIYGPFDQNSVLAYCNPVYASEVLSPQDIDATRKVYGARSDVPLAMDFDGDGDNDPAIWRPTTGQWCLLDRVTQAETVVQWGQLGDIPVPGDHDGDGDDDLGIWRPSTGQWHVARRDGSVIFANLPFGQRGDIPLRGVALGDHHDTVNVWRPTTGQWFTRQSDDGFVAVKQWGQAGDQPLVGDFSGDNYTDPAVWRFSTLHLYVTDFFGPMFLDQAFGVPPDVALAAQYDNDWWRDDLAVWSSTTGYWRVKVTGNGTAPPPRQWGQPGDVPMAGDYNGDAKADYVVYRPSTGRWYGLDPTSGQMFMNLQWGAPTQ